MYRVTYFTFKFIVYLRTLSSIYCNDDRENVYSNVEKTYKTNRNIHTKYQGEEHGTGSYDLRYLK